MIISTVHKFIFYNSHSVEFKCETIKPQWLMLCGEFCWKSMYKFGKEFTNSPFQITQTMLIWKLQRRLRGSDRWVSSSIYNNYYIVITSLSLHMLCMILELQPTKINLIILPFDYHQNQRVKSLLNLSTCQCSKGFCHQ